MQARSRRKKLQAVSGLLLLLGVLSTPVKAQTITLRHAVELALGHSGLITIADADQTRSYQGYREARAAYLPRVIMGSGIGGSYGFPLSLEGAAPSIFNVSSQQVLFNAAQGSFVRAAKSEWQATTLQSKDQRDALIQDVVLTYAELNKWSQEIDLLGTALANDIKMEAVVQERIKEGVDRLVDLNRAKLATAHVRVRTAEAKGAADVLRLHLAQLTGLTVAELETEPDSIPNLPEVKQDDDLAAKAVEASPILKAAEQRALARQFTAQGEHRALYPSVDLAGQYAVLSNTLNNYQSYFKTFQRHNASGGLVFRLPFLDSAQRARAAQAKAEALRSSREAEQAKEKVSLETLRLQRMTQELSASVEVAQLEYDLAQSELDAAHNRLQAETGTLREEQDARAKVEQAYDGLMDTSFALDRAKVQLLRNTGDLEQWARSGK